MVMINGTYKDGKIELDESPMGIAESRVVVMFPETKTPQNKIMTFGCARGTAGRESTEDDFKIAEWHGEPEFDDDF
jgi:ABC-type sulfate transport system substrate-binding protein